MAVQDHRESLPIAAPPLVAFREELALGIAALSPPLREAFLLKHVEGLEYQEMAVITGVGVSALKMRVARACEQLRARLGEIR